MRANKAILIAIFRGSARRGFGLRGRESRGGHREDVEDDEQEQVGPAAAPSWRTAFHVLDGASGICAAGRLVRLRTLRSCYDLAHLLTSRIMSIHLTLMLLTEPRTLLFGSLLRGQLAGRFY
eukprot:7388476-Prymnesium_polylepis.2